MSRDDTTAWTKIIGGVVLSSFVSAFGSSILVTSRLSEEMVWVRQADKHLSHKMERMNARIRRLQRSVAAIEGAQHGIRTEQDSICSTLGCKIDPSFDPTDPPQKP